MATAKTRKQAAASAKLGEKDFVTRLADAGEEALQRLAELPGGQKAVGAFNELRTRVDELSKKVRGIDALEARVAKLEKEIADLKRTRRAPAKRTSARKRPSTGTSAS
jgi:phage shock protein A